MVNRHSDLRHGNRGDRAVRLHQPRRRRLLGAGGLAPVRRCLECHHHVGARLSSSSRTRRCRTRPIATVIPQPTSAQPTHERLPARRGRQRPATAKRPTASPTGGRTRPSADLACNGPHPHRPRPRPVRFHQRQRRRQLRERGTRLRQRPRGHQHRDRHRVVRCRCASTTPLGSGYQNVLGGPRHAARHVIGNVYDNLGGGTNWDAGLQFGGTVRSQPGPRRRGHGRQPDRSTISDRRQLQRGELGRLHRGRDLRQPLKAGDGAGEQPESRIFAIGAGAAGTISVENIWGLAGPLTDQANILANDYLIGSADELGDALRELALARCSASLDIEKQSVGGTATFDYSGQRLGPRGLHAQHRGRQPHGQRPLRVHRPPVRGQVRPGDARARLDAHQHRLHRQRRRHHHRHRHRRRLRLAGRPPASTPATPPCGRTSVTVTPRPARTRTPRRLARHREASVGGTATFDFGRHRRRTSRPRSPGTPRPGNPTTSPPFTFTAPQFGTKTSRRRPSPATRSPTSPAPPTAPTSPSAPAAALASPRPAAPASTPATPPCRRSSTPATR